MARSPMHMLCSPMVLVPAYGRKYDTLVAMISDWNAGKDFRVKGGPYCSIRDLEGMADNASTITLYDMQTRISYQVI